MVFKQYIFLGLMLGSMTLSTASTTRSHCITKDDLKKWAENQHETLIRETALAIQNGRLKPIGINKDSVSKLITYHLRDLGSLTIIGGGHLPKNTNETDANNLPPRIPKTSNQIEFESAYFKTSFSVKASEWKKFIDSSDTRIIFWNFYFKHGTLCRDSFLNLTHEIYQSLSIHLISDINEGRSVYKDPNTQQAIDSSARLPLKTEVVELIPTNGEHAYDSVYQVDLLQWTRQAGSSIEIQVILNTQNLKTRIQSIGVKYHAAYIRYEVALQKHEMEKKLLRALIFSKTI